MAGVGPAPKDPSRRVRRNKDTVALTTIRFEQADQPELPEGFDWHPQTVAWWRMWRDSPLSDSFGATDWSFLLDTAVLHTQFWSGVAAVGAELRLRVAKFGATPEDRARLRIQFADADEKDAKRPMAPAERARQRYANVVPLRSDDRAVEA